MPLLEEMRAGQLGVKLTSYSTHVVVLVSSFVIHGLTGFFGAAMYGASTESNILVNQWLGGGVAHGILNFSMTLYLAFSLPMLEFPTRHTIDGWIPERWVTNKRLRHVVVMTAIVVICLALAVLWHASRHWRHWRVHGLVHHPSDQPSPSLLFQEQDNEAADGGA